MLKLSGDRHRALTLVLWAGMGVASCGTTAAAQRIENGVAVFAALDKVTAKISRLEVKLNETAIFGALKVTPRVCYSRPPTEPPKTSTFIEVNEVQLDGKENRIFTGWMFAESPGLHAVEHPVFDLWLTECGQPIRQQGVAEKAPPGKSARRPADHSATPQQRPPSDPLAGIEAPTDEFRRRRPR